MKHILPLFLACIPYTLMGTPITAEIALGELIDKITILEIKEERIKDAAKLANIRIELATLRATLNTSHIPLTDQTFIALKQALLEVNKKLWEIEDEIRDKEFQQCFDTEFIELARSVYLENDERCRIKRSINDRYGSHIVEEKSYKKYRKES